MSYIQVSKKNNIWYKFENHRWQEAKQPKNKNEYNPRFMDLLDNNKNLIGFENGVYDLVQSRFRHGQSDDYVSKSVGYNYEICQCQD
jgi:phage/plasmid-associated DNA primase